MNEEELVSQQRPPSRCATRLRSGDQASPADKQTEFGLACTWFHTHDAGRTRHVNAGSAGEQGGRHSCKMTTLVLLLSSWSMLGITWWPLAPALEVPARRG